MNPKATPSHELRALIERIGDATEQVRKDAHAALGAWVKERPRTLQDAEVLMRAATAPLPVTRKSRDDPAGWLVSAAADIALDLHPEALHPVIRENFSRLSARARSNALYALCEGNTPASADLYAEILETHGREWSDGWLPTFSKCNDRAIAQRLFPRLVPLVRTPALRMGLSLMLLEQVQEGLVSAGLSRVHESALVEALESEAHAAAPLQRHAGIGWRDERPYADTRHRLGVLLDLAGWMEGARLLHAAASTGGLLDPRLRRFRAVSLLRRGVRVPDDELAWIARSPRDRYWLAIHLSDSPWADRLPPACRDQSALAEGAMVDWLCFGTELGREPDEIELIRCETRRTTSGRWYIEWLRKPHLVDYYFFRFRVTEEHWSKKSGWTVGMAGGYARREQPTTSHDGGTFSVFNSYESKSVDEHVKDYLDD